MQLIAAIAWDFSSTTGELAGLASSIAAGGGIAIATALACYGVYRGVFFIVRTFDKVANSEEEYIDQDVMDEMDRLDRQQGVGIYDDTGNEHYLAYSPSGQVYATDEASEQANARAQGWLDGLEGASKAEMDADNKAFEEELDRDYIRNEDGTYRSRV